jgi:hypothetical protein
LAREVGREIVLMMARAAITLQFPSISGGSSRRSRERDENLSIETRKNHNGRVYGAKFPFQLMNFNLSREKRSNIKQAAPSESGKKNKLTCFLFPFR